MIAVFRRELNGYFKSMMGYLFSAFVLIFAGIYTMVYNLSGYTAHFERVLSSIASNDRRAHPRTCSVAEAAGRRPISCRDFLSYQPIQCGGGQVSGHAGGTAGAYGSWGFT